MMQPRADYSARVRKYLDAHQSLTAALPLLLSTGIKPVSEGCLPALSKHQDTCPAARNIIDHFSCTCAAYKVIHHFSCEHCNASMPVEMVAKLAPDDVCATLIERHLQQNPKCKSLDKLKRECILPEFFVPADRHSESKRKLQAALRDRLSRRTKFVKSLQDKPEFTVMPPPGDPTVNVFNPWTGTNFDQVCWNSLVPSCTYGLA
jgi:hypothetical protein